MTKRPGFSLVLSPSRPLISMTLTGAEQSAFSLQVPDGSRADTNPQINWMSRCQTRVS
jgi:hypothetical protein